MHSQER